MTANEKDKKYHLFAKLYLKDMGGELPSDYYESFQKQRELEEARGVPVRSARLVPSLKPVLISCVLLAVSLGCFWFVSADDVPRVSFTQGSAQISEPLREESQLTTGPQDKVLLELRKSYRIEIQPNSILRIKNLKPRFLNGRTVFHLAKGEILIKIGTEPGQKYPLEIETQNAFAKATGTQFAVMAPSAIQPQSLISVIQGVVQIGQIKNQERMILNAVSVKAGQEIYVSEELTSLTPSRIIASRKKQLDALFQFGMPNRIVLLLSMTPNRVHELLKPCPVYIQIHKRHKEHDTIKSILSQIRMANKFQNRKQHLRAVHKLEQILLSQDELDRASSLLFVGACYYDLGESGEAVRIFEKTARDCPDSSYQSLALMAAAKIYQEDLKDLDKALELAEEILTSHPNSLEAQEAAAIVKKVTVI